MITYGKTWWGKKWLESFNDIDYSNRLPRGRTYANKNAVSNIKIDNNSITAKVQGSQRYPYKVKISLQSFNKDTINNIFAIVKNSPNIVAQLINRQLPERLFNKLYQANIKLFPEKWTDIKAQCSCPDYAVPCKHIAAVIYLIAAEIDKNPFTIFELYNCDLISNVGPVSKKNIDSVQKIPQFLDLITYKNTKPKNNFDQTLLDAIDLSKIPNLHNQLYNLLTREPLFFEKDFREILHTLYKHWQRFSTRAENSEDNFIKKWRKTKQWLSITLFIDHNNHCTKIDVGQSYSLKPKDVFLSSEMLGFLNDIPSSHLHTLCPHIRILRLIQQYAVKLLEHSALIPQILQNDKNETFIRWIPALFDPTVNAIFQQLCAICPPDLVQYTNNKKETYLSPEQQILSACAIILKAYIPNNIPSSLGKYTTHHIMNLFVHGTSERYDDFNTKEIPQTIFLWLSRLYLSDKPYKIYLMIDEDDNDFALQIKISLDHHKSIHLTDLAQIVAMNNDDVLKLAILADLTLLCDYLPAIEDLIDDPNQKTIVYTLQDFTFLFFNILPILRSLGIMIILPKSLQKMVTPRLNLNLSSKNTSNEISFLNLGQLITFNWKVAIGDQQIDIHDFKKMLKESRGIVRMLDQYVILNEQEMASFIKKLEHLPDHLNSLELIQAGLGGTIMDADVNYDEHIQNIFKKFSEYKPVTIPHNLKATLRPYQERGVSWLVQNMTMGFGCILADDMGLGKTIQVIASILHFKNAGYLVNQKVLVVAPTSLLSNWQKEIQKFAPYLTTAIYHGNKRTLYNENADITITSYGLMRRDKALFNKKEWFLLIIDEAQNIKNPITAQTKAIKEIKSHHKIAMSGTPVENRLLEYWSIFDFTNKNYLGSIRYFNSSFATPIQRDHDQECLTKFHKITSPFILRRLKSDKTIIQDLPDKIENNRYCSLSSEQAALYKEIVDMTLEIIEHSAGIERKGLIFKLINALKQTCNHPSQYLKKQKGSIEQSGKMQMLEEILAGIDVLAEKTLIFTQYTEMGKLIVKMLEERFNKPVPFLHGGLSIRQRDNMVDEFQTIPHVCTMVVSLKAGGTGLNLTAANHVIHYDLWWNPAVEAQATDRAYRIGQKKNVMVYRLLTSNTFEERINDMINSKKELANLTVAHGEEWITEFTNDQIRDLVTMRQE